MKETEIGETFKQRNSLGWKLVSTNTAVVDMINHFLKLYLFLEKKDDQEKREIQCDAGYDSFAVKKTFFTSKRSFPNDSLYY